jgi:hypothetical protein
MQVGPTRADVHKRLVVTIPRSFGAPNAVANRKAFMARARELFDVAMRGNDAGSLGSPSAAGPTSVHIITIPDRDSRGVQWNWRETSDAAHVGVICDVSPSTSGIICTSQTLLHAIDNWLPEAVAGASFRVWIVGKSIDAKRIFLVESPVEDSAQRAAYLLAARNELRHVLDEPQRNAGSDIAGAITVAVSDLASKRGTKRLFLPTDLRLTAGPWAFDNSVPQPREFTRWLDAERLLPDCRNIRITVCGVHFSTTPGERPFDARRDAEIRAVWAEAFRAMRAASVEICSVCDADAFRPHNGGE